MRDDQASALLEALESTFEDFKSRLCELIRIPSVSSDPARRGEVRRSAAAFASLCEELGLTDVDIVAAGDGQPAVVAELHVRDSAPTLLVYGHHDVQPEGNPSRWTTPAYQPAEREGRLYGRGSADDKGGIVAQLAAAACYRRSGMMPPCNLRFLIEGEEEVGSPSLDQLLKLHPERFEADVVALCDTPNLDTGIPALTYRLRGNCLVDVEVRCLERPLHSGRGGGAAPDAIRILCELIARLRNPDGTINIPGLYDAVEEPGAAERAEVHELGLDEPWFRNSFGVLDPVDLACEPGFTPSEQTWLRPSLTVTAIEACPISEASNQILAAARARVSLRTVPHLDTRAAGELLVRKLQEDPPFNAIVEATVRGGPSWWKTETRIPEFEAARRALSRGYGRPAARIGAGGSIGFVGAFARRMPEVPLLLMGVEDPPCNAHAENESLHLGDWRSCMRSGVFLHHELAALRGSI